MDPWQAEHPVDDPELAALLAARVLPGLAAEPAIRVGQGWDNDVWRVGDVVLRFPRRAAAAPLIRTEAAALGWLAPRLPVAVPTPLAVGEPCDRFPAPYLAARFVPGDGADRVGLDPPARIRLAGEVGRFLRGLHAEDPVEMARLGQDVRWKADLGALADRTTRWVARLASTGWGPAEGRALARITAAPLPTPGPVVPIHGDLYARHLLVTREGALAGVIDWGDVGIGPAAIDLQVAFQMFRGDARSALLEAYGPVDDQTLELARRRALGHACGALAAAVDTGDDLLRDAMITGLDHALDG